MLVTTTTWNTANKGISEQTPWPTTADSKMIPIYTFTTPLPSSVPNSVTDTQTAAAATGCKPSGKKVQDVECQIREHIMRSQMLNQVLIMVCTIPYYYYTYTHNTYSYNH